MLDDCLRGEVSEPLGRERTARTMLALQAFAWQAAIAGSARAFHEEHGAQHALAMLLPLQASDAAPSPAAAQLVASLGPLIDVLAERVALPPERETSTSSSSV